jgi:putative tricarboxylic transport membrane protein
MRTTTSPGASVGEALLDSLSQVLQLQTLGLMLLGVAIGFVVGILPGLGGPVTLALMLPFTFGMEPVQAFAFLLGIYATTSTAGDITSVLFGIPGESTSAATVLDGHPMARRGEAGRALSAVLFSSVLGAWIGAFALALMVPIVRPLVLALGPPELFMITLLGLTFIAALAGGNLLKGYLMALLGLLVATVGIDPQGGVPRYVFDQLYLWDGIDIVPLVLGLLGGAEVLQLMLSKHAVAKQSADSAAQQLTGLRTGIADTLRHWPVTLRSSIVGIVVGIIPGMGGSVAQFLAYGQAQRSSKHPELFGKGSIEGVLAAGAVNNAKDAGSLIPTVGFGLPGSVGSAILLSAFLIVGLQPGEEMLTTRVDVTFAMVWILVLANLAAVLLSFVMLRPLVRITYISGPMLVPFLLVVLFVGAYTANNNFADIFVMLTATAFGVMCIRWDWPRVPFLLGIVLGSLAERYLLLSDSIHGLSWLTRPVVLIVAGVIVLVTFYPLVRRRLLRRLAGRQASDEPEAVLEVRK